MQRPPDTIYLADDGYESTRAFVNTSTSAAENYNVWPPTP